MSTKLIAATALIAVALSVSQVEAFVNFEGPVICRGSKCRPQLIKFCNSNQPCAVAFDQDELYETQYACHPSDDACFKRKTAHCRVGKPCIVLHDEGDEVQIACFPGDEVCHKAVFGHCKPGKPCIHIMEEGLAQLHEEDNDEVQEIGKKFYPPGFCKALTESCLGTIAWNKHLEVVKKNRINRFATLAEEILEEEDEQTEGFQCIPPWKLHEQLKKYQERQQQ